MSGRSQSREAAAPTSKYLSRVHDGESLEDLKPWRARGIELFVGEDALDISARATRGWEHVPLPECAPSTTVLWKDGDSAPEVADVDISPRLYAAVLRAVITSRGVPLSCDAVAIVDRLREALSPSKETHEVALAVVMSPQPPKRSGAALPRPAPRNATPRSIANGTTDEIVGAKKPSVDVNDVERIEAAENKPEARPGGFFACCFGGAAKPSQKTRSALKAGEKSPEVRKGEPHVPSVDRALAPEASSPNLASAPTSATEPEVECGEELREEEVAKGCATLARALWLGWRRSGGAATGGPLETLGPSRATKSASHTVTLPPGWHGVLMAFVEYYGASEVTVALAESAAIARTGEVLTTTELEEIRVRIATATAAVASGRATKRDSALRDDVAASVFPCAMRALQVCLAPRPGTDVDDTAARIRALAPTVALCMPLDTPASRFAGVLNRAAARAATDRVEACLGAPLPGEDTAALNAAEVIVAVREKDDAERDAAPAVLHSRNTTFDATTPTFARVAEAARIAAACFPLDVAAFGALPPGVSAASVASHATASTLARAATAATNAVGELYAPPYGTAFEALDSAITDLRAKTRAQNLGSSAGPLAFGKQFDQNARLALEESLLVLRPRLLDALRGVASRERGGDITAVAPDRGAMRSSSFADALAALRDAYVAATPGTVARRRDAFAREHALGVETIVGGGFRWYAEENERACLAEVRAARARLWESREDSETGRREAAAADAALLARGFYTRLSNVHACVSSVRAFREDCPLLWRSDDTSGREIRDDTDTDGDEEEMFEDENENRTSPESARFSDLTRSLRCSRAAIIAAATELLMDAVAPDFEEAALSSDYFARGTALSRALAKIDAELAAMDIALAAGAFRLAVAAVHRAACASLERLILHRAHDDIGAGVAAGELDTSGGSLSGTAAPLTEAQHSRVVELASALEDFLSAENDGVPAQVLVDGEQRLRRLLNLWFTPTVEVAREYWRQIEVIESNGGGARLARSGGPGGGPGEVVRPSHGGGVGPLDLLRLLAQRGDVSADGDAATVVQAQLSAAAAAEAQAVLGLPLGEIVVASFVCRDDATTLGGRLFVTQMRCGFSPCGVGPDHPHEAHIAFSAKIEHVTRAWKTDFEGTKKTPALRITLVDGKSLQFDCFVGGARARDLALEGLRASAAAHRPRSPFLANETALAPVDTSRAALPHGETARRAVSCALERFVELSGTLFVTSASLLWLPVGDDTTAREGDAWCAVEGGTRVAFEDIDSVEASTRGWRDRCVTVRFKPKAGKLVSDPPARFARLTQSSAIALRDDILQAMAALDEPSCAGTSA